MTPDRPATLVVAGRCRSASRRTVVGVATLVYLYGPPAAGKLTIAEALVERTGFRLFHTHLTGNAVRAVVPFGSPPFVTLVHRFRLEMFATAMREGVDVVFTNNSMWGGDGGRARFAAFAGEADRVVTAAGGATCFVHVRAPDDVLLARVAAETRGAHGKLVDPGRLQQMLDTNDRSPLHDDHLRIDSSALTPEEAADRIVAALRERS